MTMVNDINGKAIDFEAAMALADPEICEEFAPYFGLAW